MPIKIENQAEPIPGYRLIERLGGGGFGEVWKAEAPGGLHKAIKFVYGDLEGHAAEEGARAEQELKALSRVKTVHHPYILSLERFDIIDGQLIIVMELADRTLWDRFRECRNQGLIGIPRDELLRYLNEAAEALDLMNNQYQLQHLDIKPQNLFLVHNHVKVADFGLVKDLEGSIASVTGGVTPVYAAPETFEGYVSCFSDQYSLAIVYQELLTGQRPFQGTTVRQLILQHLREPPNLSSLPPADRSVVARALDKIPERRFPTCGEFIAALLAAEQGTSAEASSLPLPPPDQPPLPLVPPVKEPPVGEPEPCSDMQTQGRPQARSEPPGPGPAVPQEEQSQVGPLTPPARKSPDSQGPTSPIGVGDRAALVGTPPAGTTNSTTIHPPPRRTALPVSSEGVLLPALVVGLGRQGQAILREFRRQILEQFGRVDALPNVRFLYLDTDPETLQEATQGGEHALRPQELLLTRLHRAAHYLRPRETQNPLDTWLPRGMVYRISRQQVPNGIRCLGRLAFVDNYPAILRRLRLEMEACLDGAFLKEAARLTGLGILATTPRVYIVTGLGGGTGSGVFVDVAYNLRSLLRELGHPAAEIAGIFLLPADGQQPGQVAALANTVAALTELRHFATPGVRFQAHYPSSDSSGRTTVFTEAGAPFQRCLLIASEEEGWKPSQRSEQSPPEPPVLHAAATLYLELCTPLGRLTERQRREWTSLQIHWPADENRPLLYQSSGLYRIVWPRQQLLTRVGRILCQRLVQRWMNKDATALKTSIKDWVGQQWQSLRLAGEDLITRLQELCEHSLGQPPETLFATLVALLAPPPPAGQDKETAGGRGARSGGSSVPPEPLRPEAVIEVLEQLEQLLGVPEGCRSPATGKEASMAEPGLLVETLREGVSKLASECELRLAQLVVRLIEQPDFRLAGAEETIRQLSATVERALAQQEPLTRELLERATACYQRMVALLESPVSPPGKESSGWKLGFGKKTGSGGAGQDSRGDEMLELLRVYPKYRYQGLILQHINSFYVGLRGQLSDQLREVDYCRQRLSELAAMFNDEKPTKGGKRPAPPIVHLPSPAGKMLFPGGCRDFDEAEQRLEQILTATDVQQFDLQAQELIRGQFQALVHVCMASANMVRALQPALQAQAENYVLGRLGSPDVVQMYLEQHTTREESSEESQGAPSLPDALIEAFEEAGASLGRQGEGNEVTLLGVPPGLCEKELRQAFHDAMPDVAIAPFASTEEVILYRERWHTSLAELRYPSKPALEAYQRLTSQENYSPHARIDLPCCRSASG